MHYVNLTGKDVIIGGLVYPSIGCIGINYEELPDSQYCIIHYSDLTQSLPEENDSYRIIVSLEIAFVLKEIIAREERSDIFCPMGHLGDNRYRRLVQV